MIPGDQSVRTKRRALGQVVLCSGCCCGRVDKGRPYLPEEKIKAIWKAERLYKTIQLTISGCLGPCDVANVVQVVTPAGTEWFGHLDQETQYDALIDWARACHSAKLLCRYRPGLPPFVSKVTSLTNNLAQCALDKTIEFQSWCSTSVSDCFRVSWRHPRLLSPSRESDFVWRPRNALTVIARHKPALCISRIPNWQIRCKPLYLDSKFRSKSTTKACSSQGEEMSGMLAAPRHRGGRRRIADSEREISEKLDSPGIKARTD